MRRLKETESEVNYRWKNIVIMFGICAAGLGTITLASFFPPDAARHVITTLGESLLVGGLLGFAFELALRRDMLNMIFEMRDSIDANKRWGDVSKELGLANIYTSDRELDTKKLIRGSINLVLIMNDGRTWLSSHEADIEERLSRSDRETVAYFVHPKSPHLESLSSSTAS